MDMSPDALALQQTGQSSAAIQSFNAGEKRASRTPTADSAMDKAAFDQLLHWLNPDIEAAGWEYEVIRRKLIKVFTCRGCASPEDLADETFNRVARKLLEIKPKYVGSPVKYFYGVAKNIYKEYLRSTSAQHLQPAPVVKEDLEELLQRLDYALSKLERTDRDLILSYYAGEGQSKINHRKALAKQMGLQLNGLRLRVYRIRSRLRAYLEAENRVKSIC